jgi:MFS family permease
MAAAGRSYDYDSSETVGNFIATPSLLDPFRRQLGYNNHPLFSFLEHLVYSAGGRSETALRVLPCLFGAVAVGLLAGWLGRRWGLPAGLAAGLLLAAEPLFASESRSVRGYSLLTLCAVASTLLLIRLLEQPSRWTQVGYLVVVAAGTATHLYMLFIMLGQLAAIAASRRLRLVWPVVLGVVIGGSVYSGLAAKMIAYSRHQQGHFDAAFPWAAAQALLGERTLAVALFATLAAVGIVLLRRRTLFAATIAIACAFLLDWAVLAPRDLYPRFLVWLTAAFAALAAAAVRRLPVTVLIAAAVAGLMVNSDRASWTLAPLPSRQAATMVTLLTSRGDRVCALPYTTGALMAYLHHLPPEVNQPAQFTRCDALVELAIGPRSLLLAARTRFPFRTTLPATTPMIIRCRQRCRP